MPYAGWIHGAAGLFGSLDGSLMRLPPWVDAKKPPGATTMPYCAPGWWWRLIVDALTGYSTLCSPDLYWLLPSFAIYFLVPYEMAAAAEGFSAGWIGRRAAANVVLTMSWVAQRSRTQPHPLRCPG